MTSLPDGYVRRGGRSTIIASLSTAVSLFAIFRIGLELGGAEAVGIWSLLQGLFIIARIADSGAGSNVTRFVASKLLLGATISVRRTLVASWIIGTGPTIVLGAALYLPIYAYASDRYGHEVGAGNIATYALYAFLFGAFSSAATLCLAVFEGTFRLVEKNWIVIGSNVFGILGAFPLLALFGGPGIGLTYVLMATSQLVIALIALRRKKLPAQVGPVLSIGSTIREIWKENFQLTGVAIVRLSFEPTTKFFLSLVAPLGAIAAFELALRVSTQVRILIQSAVQPLLTFGSRNELQMSREIELRFTQVNDLVTRLTGRVAVIQLVSAPLVSLVGLGTLDSAFILFFLVLSIANSLNALGLVGYYFQLSSGQMTPLLKIQIAMAAMNVSLGIVAVLLGSPILVTIAYGAAFVFGGLASSSLLLTYLRVGTLQQARRQGLWISLLAIVVAAGVLGIVSGQAGVADVPIVAVSAGLGVVAVAVTGFQFRHLLVRPKETS